MKYIIIPIMTTLASCSSVPHLEVASQYWSRRDLASTVINTPDPEKNSQLFGQRLNISWYVPKKNFQSGSADLFLRVKLKNNEEINQTIPLKSSSGTYQFPIYGDDFTKKGGLLSYSVELRSGGKTLKTENHKLWVEPISFS